MEMKIIQQPSTLLRPFFCLPQCVRCAPRPNTLPASPTLKRHRQCKSYGCLGSLVHGVRFVKCPINPFLILKPWVRSQRSKLKQARVNLLLSTCVMSVVCACHENIYNFPAAIHSQKMFLESSAAQNPKKWHPVERGPHSTRNQLITDYHIVIKEIII